MPSKLKGIKIVLIFSITKPNNNKLLIEVL